MPEELTGAEWWPMPRMAHAVLWAIDRDMEALGPEPGSEAASALGDAVFRPSESFAATAGGPASASLPLLPARTERGLRSRRRLMLLPLPGPPWKAAAG